jgi:hypothetical protein
MIPMDTLATSAAITTGKPDELGAIHYTVNFSARNT